MFSINVSTLAIFFPCFFYTHSLFFCFFLYHICVWLCITFILFHLGVRCTYLESCCLWLHFMSWQFACCSQEKRFKENKTKKLAISNSIIYSRQAEEFCNSKEFRCLIFTLRLRVLKYSQYKISWNTVFCIFFSKDRFSIIILQVEFLLDQSF